VGAVHRQRTPIPFTPILAAVPRAATRPIACHQAESPTGTVTFVFTDIEGSTAVLQRLGPDRFRDALEDHNRLIRDAFTAGVEVGSKDAFAGW
jgi:class 3 adenylate cyclase